jgi:hypothetical protein
MRIVPLVPILLVLSTFAGAWALVLGWWQARDHVPSIPEMALYLLALPLSLTGGFWFLRRFFDMLRNPSASPVRSAADAGSDTPAQAPASPTLLHAGALALAAPHADSPARLLAAVADHLRPELDQHLRDDDGYPILSARAEAADENAAQLPVALTSEARRALSLLDASLHETLSAVTPLSAENGPVRRLSIFWALPAHWPTAWHGALRDWLTGHVLHDHALPPVHIAFKAYDDGATLLNDVTSGAATLPDDTLLLVCSADSAIGEQSVSRWHAAARLHTAARPDGLIPGEAAASLVLCGRAIAEVHPDIFNTAIGATATTSRQRPLAHRRGDHAALGEALSDASAAAGIEIAGVAALVADSGHHGSTIGELLRAAGEHCPEAGGDACAALGTVCGSATPAGTLLALVSACAKAGESNAPVLCVSHTHDTRIAAIAAVPAALAGAPHHSEMA